MATTTEDRYMTRTNRSVDAVTYKALNTSQTTSGLADSEFYVQYMASKVSGYVDGVGATVISGAVGVGEVVPPAVSPPVISDETWACPASVGPYNRILVEVWKCGFSKNFMNMHQKFITEDLGEISIDSNTWTFNYGCRRWTVGGKPPAAYQGLYYGDNSPAYYNSHIDNVKYSDYEGEPEGEDSKQHSGILNPVGILASKLRGRRLDAGLLPPFSLPVFP